MTDEVLIERMHRAIDKGHMAVEKDHHKDTYACETDYFLENIMDAASTSDIDKVYRLIRECYFLGVYRGLDKRRS